MELDRLTFTLVIMLPAIITLFSLAIAAEYLKKRTIKNENKLIWGIFACLQIYYFVTLNFRTEKIILWSRISLFYLIFFQLLHQNQVIHQ